MRLGLSNDAMTVQSHVLLVSDSPLLFTFLLRSRSVFSIIQYKEAGEDLELALKHCHRDAKRNKRRILNHLVPLKLRLGV